MKGLKVLGLGWGIALAFFFAFKGRGPFSDEGSVCLLAQEILNGRLPYRDYFNEKVPLQYLWTALVMRASTDGIDGARIASTIALGVTGTLALSTVARRADVSRLMPWWAIAIALIGLTMRAYNNTAESTLALLFVACAVLVFGGHTMRPRFQGLLVGCLQGLACGTRQTSIVPALILLIAPWHRAPRAWYIAGFGIGVAAWTGALWHLGILSDALAATITFHIDNPAVASYVRGLQGEDYPALLVWLLLLLFVGIASATRRGEWWVPLWAVSVALAFFGRMDAFRLWSSAMLMVAYLSMRLGARASVAALVPLVLVAAVGSWAMPRPASFVRLEVMKSRIEAFAAPGEPIWVGPFDPTVYCVARRRAASKYYFIVPWLAKPGVREQLLADLETSKPKVIVDVSDSLFSMRQLFPSLDGLLERHYVRAEQYGDAGYFVLKDDRSLKKQ